MLLGYEVGPGYCQPYSITNHGIFWANEIENLYWMKNVM